MDAREKMIQFRKKRNLSYQNISDRCGVSKNLIAMVEEGHVTHPNLVKKLKIFYKLTDLEAEELLPVNRRPHDARYEPDKWVKPEYILRDPWIQF